MTPLTEDELARPLTAEEEAELRANLGGKYWVGPCPRPASPGCGLGPYGGHPEFGPRVMANQAQPSIAGWESLARDALLAFDQARAALAASPAPDPGAGPMDDHELSLNLAMAIAEAGNPAQYKTVGEHAAAIVKAMRRQRAVSAPEDEA